MFANVCGLSLLVLFYKPKPFRSIPFSFLSCADVVVCKTSGSKSKFQSRKHEFAQAMYRDVSGKNVMPDLPIPGFKNLNWFLSNKSVASINKHWDMANHHIEWERDIVALIG